MPITVGLHNEFLEHLKAGLGYYYDDDSYYLKTTEFKSSYVYFDRFCFDIISLSGRHLIFMSVHEYEIVLRKLFQNITLKFA